jgi:osmotically-inducible protein OsmY
VSPHSQLKAEVRAAIDRDPRILNPVDIAVSEHAGTVTLRGTVSGFKQRRAAVEDANAPVGVNEVLDELQVRLLEDDARDDWLRGAILQRLAWDSEAPAEFIDVAVKDGWVTLKGELKHQFQSDAAFEVAAGTTGVGGITNQIKVVTAG